MSETNTKSAYGLGRAARLNLTYEILNELADTGRALDAILSSRFRHLQDALQRRDRRDLEQRVRSVLLHYRRLLWWVERARLDANMRSLLLADMVLNADADIDQLQKLCNGAHNRMDMMRKEEITGLKRLLRQDINHPDMNEAVRCECPDWAEAGLRKAFQDNFANEMGALSQKPHTDFRVNTLQAGVEDVANSLNSQGVKVAPTPLSPVGLRQTEAGGPILSETDAFRNGWIDVQDEGSQLVALMVGAKKSMQVVDFCAGAGGKSLALAADMENGGHLVACDVHSKRLHRAKVRLKRAGVVNAERRLLEQTFDKWVKKSRGKFDRVLIDAPCSGTGTWRRNPDSKWSRDDTDLQELIALQKEILDSASRLVKPGGRLVYATCSLLPQENEDQIARFLKEKDGFQIKPARDVWAERLDTPYPGTGADFLRLSPYRQDCDGFFAAVLEKQ